ncbi:MAG: phenylacetic acid degradation protein [Meiothermus sp.]|uniref:phenylacetic acid degradation protein n=1 Tax=Meiothermus sp. TaxID=1955249 RepID=UPI0025F6E248|nr:phenylacetic acid degradation protein [Meiothermus sp.]MCS7059490.1 phenylacetic acid degradation protein [Meiothermus sp.]MCS7194017.1 phenylacetic acid degradation protein [Meiothermus sp.]MCX7740955.1 phenylacetic acid degradation protein [Meiothermus sp.]MDW8090225.1 phenylacetic acid degradation protein [Meiothermus sp.]MDW8481193.1 phenylacetic acid degradation protein [Meiothermus sp.]
MDTQWPRWEVFKQDAPGKPHQAVGSVHAADPEHALLTARNVFARRPQAVSLWVVRAEEVFSWTKEEIAQDPALQGGATPARGLRPTSYLVFRKTSHKRSMTFVDHVGEVQACSPQEALREALARFRDAEGLAWWVVAAEKVHRSDPSQETVESWFAPAKEKTYKQQQYYTTVSASRPKRRGEDEAFGEGCAHC